MFLKVRRRFIDIYKQNWSHTASTWRRTLQGPLYNTVRTPTAEDCLGNYFNLNLFSKTHQEMNIHENRSIRRGLRWNSFNLGYSLELVLTLGKHHAGRVLGISMPLISTPLIKGLDIFVALTIRILDIGLLVNNNSVRKCLVVASEKTHSCICI